VNATKYNTANRALDAAGSFLAAVDGALSTAESSTVQYSLEKAPQDAWNFLLGAQYQYNKHFMLRAEYGFLGSRKQFLTSLQYRFGL
jgi:long-subunit fatty acid transport protein